MPAVAGEGQSAEASPSETPRVDPLPPDVPQPPPAELPPADDPTAPIQPVPTPGATPSDTAPAPTVPSTGAATPPVPPTTGTPTPESPPGTSGTLPGATPDVKDALVHLKADWGIVRPEPNTFRARGNVHLTYRDVILTSDEMDADLKTHDVHMKGNVVIQSGNRSVRGDDLTFNLRTRQWTIGRGRASYLPRQLLSPLYVKGEFGGEPHLIRGEDGSLTTCDLPEPHYHIQGRKVTIIPEKRAVIEHASLYVRGRRWLTLPRLVIPLQPSRYNIVPTAGQNNVEGYFVKTAYYYPVKAGDTGIARFDLMSKKGIGIGADQSYKYANGAGQVILYSVLGAGALQGKEWNGSIRHRQKLGALEANLQSSVRSNSYQFAPGNTSSSHSLDLTRRTPHGNTTLGFRFDGSSGGGLGNYSREGYLLDHNQTWGRNTARVNLNLFNTQTLGNVEKELNTQVTLDRRLPAYDLGFNYDRHDQLESTNTGFFSSLDRLPEVVFGTNRRRVKGGLFHYLPGSFGLSVGDYHEEPGDVGAKRILLDLGMDNRRSKFGNSELNVSGGFKQAFYSNNAAQYLVNTNANWKTAFTRHNEFAVNYLLFSQQGYTPFRFDTLGEYHMVTADYVHRERSLRLAIGSGRDLRGGQFAWSDARVRLQYRPSDAFYLAAGSAYDLNNHRWRDVITDSRFKFGQGYLNLGVRYTPLTHQVGTVQWNFFTPLGRKYSIQTLGSYNGFSKQYDYRLLRFNWEHHDFRASISYVEQVGFQSQKGLRLMVHLRALPIREENAVGAFGQSLNTMSVGEIF